MKIYHIQTSAKKPSDQTQEPKEYQLEKNGLLYDENGDDVFSIKDLLKFNVPTFKSSEQANEFLTQLEQTQGRTLGRVP